MHDFSFQKDSQDLLNHCTKYLARFNTDARHRYAPDDSPAPRDRIAEAWRFPIVDTYAGGAPAVTDPQSFVDYNEVTFVYAGADASTPASVAVIGTFATLYEPIPLARVAFEGEPTRYWALTFAVPKSECHLYKFVVDGEHVNDPVNPQEQVLENGAVWSRFFTESFTTPLVFERWELDILYRLVAQIAPFRTAEAENFLDRFYNYLDRGAKEDLFNNIYRLDDSVGEVNYIDNILAREERHRLVDYKICLRILDRVLRQRNPYTEPAAMSPEIYKQLYDEMATDRVSGWDYQRYGSPRFFLYILRRHAVVGAFSHPKYGGNTGGAGWAYLAERYTGPAPAPGVPAPTLFDWRRALEKPLGANEDYLG